MKNRLRYQISMPERTLRAFAAGGGGFLHEVSLLLIPAWLRQTRIYRATVAGLLRITIELIGGAKGIMPASDVDVQEFTMRKTAGTGIEFAGLLTLGWSPLWLFAGVADITGGTRAYLKVLVSELKTAGFLAEDTAIHTVIELLDALEETSGLAAETVDVPPLTLAGMRETWQGLRQNAGHLPDGERIKRIYNDMQNVAKKENRSVASLSKTIGIAAARAGIQTGHTYIFDFYAASLRTIASEGLTGFLKREMLPYRSVAASHFDPERTTYTERLLERLHL